MMDIPINHKDHHMIHGNLHLAVRHTNENHLKLAFSTTIHCLIGCGLGEVVGMIIAV
jgi:hypothetical protein